MFVVFVVVVVVVEDVVEDVVVMVVVFGFAVLGVGINGYVGDGDGFGVVTGGRVIGVGFVVGFGVGDFVGFGVFVPVHRNLCTF